jgi:hypothetical protein
MSLMSGSLPNAGIDVEHHRHVDLLVRVEPLLSEAETLDFVEVDAAAQRRNVERGMTGDGLVAEVLGGEIYQFLLSQMHGYGGLVGHKAPWQARRDVGIERHGDGLLGNLGGIGGNPLRGPGEPGRGAEHAIQRRRIGDQHTHDADRDQATKRHPSLSTQPAS